MIIETVFMLALSCKLSFCSRVATLTTFLKDKPQCLCYISEIVILLERSTFYMRIKPECESGARDVR
jgi:hypothetical protein